MRAIVIDNPGEPEVMRLDEVADPVAGDGEVLLRVEATAVNRADILQRRGFYPPPAGASAILGLEATGEVVAVGAGVSAWRPGVRALALLAGGGYAELVAVPQGQLLPIPPGLETDQGAAIPEAFLTADDNLFTRGRLVAGETVLIHGGASGVGTAAIQLARRAGARVLVTAGTEERLERCRQLGAEGAINHRSEDFVERSRELTGSTGVDLILDIMGASYLARNLAALAPDGRLVVIGLQGGTSAEIDLNTLLRGRLTLIATTLRGRPLDQKAAIVERGRREVIPGFIDGSLQPVVHTVLPLAEAAAAHRIVEAGENVGKVVLHVA